MDNEMIERCAENIHTNCGLAITWINAPELYKEGKRRDAKSCIKAMREPTEKMVEAANFISTAQSGVYGPEDVWQAMIDAIIND